MLFEHKIPFVFSAMKKLKPMNPRVVLFFRYAFLLVVIVFAAYYLLSQWADVYEALSTISIVSLLISFFCLLCGIVCGTMSWVSVLNGLGSVVSIPHGSQIMLVGQLGKYVPGSVWSYVMQMELGRQYGISRPRILVTGLYAAGIGVVSSLILGGFALPTVIAGRTEILWLFALLPVGLLCLHPRIMTRLASFVLKIFRRKPLEHKVDFKTVGLAVAYSLASYSFYGLHLWILTNALVDPDFQTLILLIGAISLGFTTSLFAFIFPSGVGVREAVLISAMTFLLTTAQAAAISLISRLMFTLADLFAAGSVVLFILIIRRKSQS